ncbi:MAG: sulfatase-like hydrolase/transferase [Candidatus Latescibacteria bacterium]|nr:sulfatase-like hydrolase/transferase [Candidatus Latescibacterota bacterium]
MNVIVVMLDSLRADHVGAYGPARARTPNLDRFAAGAQVFDQVYAGSFPTLPCRRDLFTGRWGHPFNTWDEMERDLPTMAETFRRAGYKTGLIFDTPMFMTQGNFLDRGFGSIEWIRGQGGEPWISDAFADIELPAAEHKVKAEGLRRYLLNQSRRRYETDYLVARTMMEATHWLERNYTQEQFFLWVDSWDPHEPWDPPAYYVEEYDPGYQGDEVIYPCYGFSLDIMSAAELRHVQALYAAEVTMVDRWVGHFLDTVELLGLLDNTAVLVMADHGHYFGDHGLQGKPWGDLGQLYEPMVHLPFMLYHPDAGAGRRPGLVQPVDVMPTLCELAGLKTPAGVQGRSFAELLAGRVERHRDCAISGRNLDDHWGTVPATVTDGTWTLIYWPNKDLKYKGKSVRQETYPNTGMPERRVDELFHMPTDPGQETNVLATHPQEARRLHAALVELVEATATEPALAATYQPLPGEMP